MLKYYYKQNVDKNKWMIQKFQDMKKRRLTRIQKILKVNKKQLLQKVNTMNNKYDQKEELDCQLNINKLIKLIEDLTKEKEALEIDQRRLEQMIPEKQNKVEMSEKEEGLAEANFNKWKTDLKVESRFLMKQKEELESKLNHLINKQMND